MSVPARYPFARVQTDDGEVLVELTKFGPAFSTGKLSCGIFLRAPQPSVSPVPISDLSPEERTRFRLPPAVAA